MRQVKIWVSVVRDRSAGGLLDKLLTIEKREWGDIAYDFQSGFEESIPVFLQCLDQNHSVEAACFGGIEALAIYLNISYISTNFLFPHLSK